MSDIEEARKAMWAAEDKLKRDRFLAVYGASFALQVRDYMRDRGEAPSSSEARAFEHGARAIANLLEEAVL